MPSSLLTVRCARPVEVTVAATGSRLVMFCVEVSAPAGTWLIRLPAASACVSTWIVQIRPAFTEALVSVTLLSPGVAVSVPSEQPVPVNCGLGAAASTRPAGRWSSRLTPVRFNASPAVFTMRRYIVEVPIRSTTAGSNDLVSVTLPVTRVMLAVMFALLP